MNRAEQIRAALHVGPMTNAELAAALGLTGRQVAKAVYDQVQRGILTRRAEDSRLALGRLPTERGSIKPTQAQQPSVRAAGRGAGSGHDAPLMTSDEWIAQGGKVQRLRDGDVSPRERLRCMTAVVRPGKKAASR